MVGKGNGEGTSVNIPWPTSGFGDADYLYAFQNIVMPIAYEFNPDLVISMFLLRGWRQLADSYSLGWV
jgi:histone deacetylase 6